MIAGTPHARPAQVVRAATTAQPRVSSAPELLLGAGVGPLFVLITLIGLTG